MDKPLPLLIADTKQALVEILNESKLPPCIMTPIVKELYDAALQAQQAELEQVKEQMKQAEGDKKK